MNRLEVILSKRKEDFKGSPFRGGIDELQSYTTFGEGIRYYLHENKLKLTKVARQVGISKQYLSEISYDKKHGMSTDLVVQIANAIEMPLHEALRLTGRLPDAIRKAYMENNTFALTLTGLSEIMLTKGLDGFECQRLVDIAKKGGT